MKKLKLIIAMLCLTSLAFAGKNGWSPCFKNEIEFPKSGKFLLNLGMTHLETKDGYYGKMISPHTERCDIGFSNEGYRIEDIAIWDLKDYKFYKIKGVPADCTVVQKKETLTFYGKYDPDTQTIKNLRCTATE